MSAQSIVTGVRRKTSPGVAQTPFFLWRARLGRPAGLALMACASLGSLAQAQILGSASNFAVLGATPNVSNTGASAVTGNVGVWPASAITGFPPGNIVPGTGLLHRGDAIAQQAQTDTTTAYLRLQGLVNSPIAPALGGQTLTPGIYDAGAANLTGTLTLNGPGLYVIQTTALTTSSGGTSAVNLIGGASACDVWWQVGSSAAIGTGSSVAGNILALTSITLATGASLQGRALARNGTVTLDTNAVTACAGGTAAGYVVPGVVAIGTEAGAIPVLSEWAKVILTILLAITGFATLRRLRPRIH